MSVSSLTNSRAWRGGLFAGVLLATLAACTPRAADQAAAAGSDGAKTTRLCATCGQPLVPTDRTATRWAKVERLYRCPAGHEEWATDFETRRVRQNVVSDPCPSCGQQLTWTGQTRGFGGDAIKVYSCPSGHTVDRRQ